MEDVRSGDLIAFAYLQGSIPRLIRGVQSDWRETCTPGNCLEEMVSHVGLAVRSDVWPTIPHDTVWILEATASGRIWDGVKDVRGRSGVCTQLRSLPAIVDAYTERDRGKHPRGACIWRVPARTRWNENPTTEQRLCMTQLIHDVLGAPYESPAVLALHKVPMPAAIRRQLCRPWRGLYTCSEVVARICTAHPGYETGCSLQDPDFVHPGTLVKTESVFDVTRKVALLLPAGYNDELPPVMPRVHGVQFPSGPARLHGVDRETTQVLVEMHDWIMTHTDQVQRVVDHVRHEQHLPAATTPRTSPGRRSGAPPPPLRDSASPRTMIVHDGDSLPSSIEATAASASSDKEEDGAQPPIPSGGSADTPPREASSSSSSNEPIPTSAATTSSSDDDAAAYAPPLPRRAWQGAPEDPTLRRHVHVAVSPPEMIGALDEFIARGRSSEAIAPIDTPVHQALPQPQMDPLDRLPTPRSPAPRLGSPRVVYSALLGNVSSGSGTKPPLGSAPDVTPRPIAATQAEEAVSNDSADRVIPEVHRVPGGYKTTITGRTIVLDQPSAVVISK